MASKTKEIVSDFHAHILQAGDFTSLSNYVAENVVFHTPYLPSPLIGRDKFEAFMTEVFSSITGLRVTTNEIIAEGNRASVRWIIEGVSSQDFMNIPAGNDNHIICIMSHYHLKSGKIIEAWAVDTSMWPRVFDF